MNRLHSSVYYSVYYCCVHWACSLYCYLQCKAVCSAGSMVGKYRNFGQEEVPEQPLRSRLWGGSAGDGWRGSELPVQSECSLSLGLEPYSTTLLCLKPVGKFLLHSTGAGNFPWSLSIVRTASVKGLHSWVWSDFIQPVLGQCLLEPLRSDPCRYPQLLFSLISEAVVKRCCTSSKGTDLLPCTFAPFAIRKFFLGRNCVTILKKCFFSL